MLGSFSENTDKKIFYTTLWGCIYSSPSIRLPGITFIMTRLNRKGVGNQEYLLGNDPPLLVSVIHCMYQPVLHSEGDTNCIEWAGMLDISVRGVNCRFWYHLDGLDSKLTFWPLLVSFAAARAGLMGRGALPDSGPSSCKGDYNPGQNKMEQHTPIPTPTPPAKSRMKPRKSQDAPFFYP